MYLHVCTAGIPGWSCPIASAVCCSVYQTAIVCFGDTGVFLQRPPSTTDCR